MAETKAPTVVRRGETVDVLIVGAGPSGSVAAKHLSAAGFSVSGAPVRSGTSLMNSAITKISTDAGTTQTNTLWTACEIATYAWSLSAAGRPVTVAGSSAPPVTWN